MLTQDSIPRVDVEVVNARHRLRARCCGLLHIDRHKRTQRPVQPMLLRGLTIAQVPRVTAAVNPRHRLTLRRCDGGALGRIRHSPPKRAHIPRLAVREPEGVDFRIRHSATSTRVTGSHFMRMKLVSSHGRGVGERQTC